MLSNKNTTEIFKTLDEIYKNPKTELDFVNNYTLLVAVVLSAQSTDKGVNKATLELFKVVKTPQQMLNLGLENLQNHIKTIGLYKNKAKNVIALSEILLKYSKENILNSLLILSNNVDDTKALKNKISDDEIANFLYFYDAKTKDYIFKNLSTKKKSLKTIEIIDNNKEILIENLIALAGVGRKTANVVLNVAFNLITMPVDTHLFRLAHRWGLSVAKTPEGVEVDLLNKIPKKYLPKAHHLMILFGRYTCKAKGFKCLECPLNNICPKIGI
jgi:endonuclease-3